VINGQHRPQNTATWGRHRQQEAVIHWRQRQQHHRLCSDKYQWIAWYIGRWETVYSAMGNGENTKPARDFGRNHAIIRRILQHETLHGESMQRIGLRQIGVVGTICNGRSVQGRRRLATWRLWDIGFFMRRERSGTRKTDLKTANVVGISCILLKPLIVDVGEKV